MLVARFKSGAYTVERPLHLGAALAGRLPELAPALTGFGRPLGEAFQLRDDLLGVFGSEAETGKPVGEDLREGKPTLLLGLTRRLAGPAGAGLLERVGRPDLSAGEVGRLARLMEECGARAAVEQAIADRQAAALDALAGAPVEPGPRRCLQDLAGRCLWRAA